MSNLLSTNASSSVTATPTSSQDLQSTTHTSSGQPLFSEQQLAITREHITTYTDLIQTSWSHPDNSLLPARFYLASLYFMTTSTACLLGMTDVIDAVPKGMKVAIAEQAAKTEKNIAEYMRWKREYMRNQEKFRRWKQEYLRNGEPDDFTRFIQACMDDWDAEEWRC